MLCKPIIFLSDIVPGHWYTKRIKMGTHFHLAAPLHYSWKKSEEAPFMIIFYSIPIYIFLHNWNICRLFHFFASLLHRPFLQTVSKACLKSTNAQNSFFSYCSWEYVIDIVIIWYGLWSMVECCFIIHIDFH